MFGEARTGVRLGGGHTQHNSARARLNEAALEVLHVHARRCGWAGVRRAARGANHARAFSRERGRRGGQRRGDRREGDGGEP